MISGPFTTSTPIPYTLTDWHGSLSFPMFDSALGTLTEVDMTLTGDMQTTLTVTNSSPDPSSGNANTEVQMSVQDAGLNFSPPQIDFYSPAFGYSLAGGGSVSSGLLTKTGSGSEVYTLSAILAEFNGPGTIALPASTFTQTVLSNTGGNTAASQVTQADLTGTVTYHYNPVPEPSTLALFGVAALGLLVGAAATGGVGHRPIRGRKAKRAIQTDGPFFCLYAPRSTLAPFTRQNLHKLHHVFHVELAQNPLLMLPNGLHRHAAELCNLLDALAGHQEIHDLFLAAQSTATSPLKPSTKSRVQPMSRCGPMRSEQDRGVRVRRPGLPKTPRRRA